MVTRENIETLHAWTHACLDALFAHVSTLPQPLFVKDIEGFGVASIRDQLVHILFCEAAWIQSLQGRQVAPWTNADYTTVASLGIIKKQVMTATLKYLLGITEIQLNTDLEQRPTNWWGPLRSPSFILLHVFTHAFHHKGQVAAQCRILGYPAPDTDMRALLG